MVYVFNGLTALSCTYALARGGAPERLAALIVLLGLASAWASLLLGYRGFGAIKMDIFAEDIAMLVALQAVALFADRFWPIWVAGLQLATVFVHLTRALTPELFPLAYAIGLWSWGYLIVLALAIGTYRHRRRVVQSGREPDWSFERRRGAL